MTLQTSEPIVFCVLARGLSEAAKVLFLQRRATHLAVVEQLANQHVIPLSEYMIEDAAACAADDLHLVRILMWQFVASKGRQTHEVSHTWKL